MKDLSVKIVSELDRAFQIEIDHFQRPVFSEETYILNTKVDGQNIIYIAFYLENEIVAAIPLVRIQNKFLNSFATPPLCPCTTVLLSSKHNNKVTLSNCLRKLQSKHFLKSIDQLSFSLDIQSEADFLNQKKRLTHVIELNQSEEEIFSNFRTDKKRNIKKQTKEGIIISFEKNTDVLVRLIEMTYSRQNKSVNWIKSIENLSRNYPNSYQITAHINEEAVASLFFVYDKNKAYYLAGGFNDKVGNYNAGPIAMWEGIKHAKRLGLMQFDFEGSRVESIRNYFLSFGSTPLEFPVYSYQSVKFKIVQWLKKF